MINSTALVSIIVPIYGTEEYLTACIESLCKQTYSNIEIILVDDQSPDRCPEICDRFAEDDSRITVIHQRNTGVSGARNTGIRHAKGDYFMFVDSDDTLCHDAVEVLLRDAHKYKADVVFAAVRSIQLDGSFSDNHYDGSYTFFTNDDALLHSLQGSQDTIGVHAKLFDASFIQDIFFEEGKNLNEDGFFLFQVFLRKPVLVRDNVVVYIYNNRADSGSRQGFSDKYLSMLYFCDRKKELIAAQYPQYTDQVHNMEVRTNLQFLDVLCRTTEKKYKEIQRQSIRTVRKLYQYHKPVNDHHRMLAWIVKYGLYPLYKWAIRMKYYR